MICNKCGKEIADNAGFCSWCGNKVETPNQAVQQPVIQQPQPVSQQSVQQPAQPVVQQPVQQPAQPVPQQTVQQPMQTVQPKTSGLSGAQKGIIVGLLLVVVVLLGVVVFSIVGGKGLHDGSRTIMIYVVGSNLETDSGIVSVDLDAIDPGDIDLEKTHILLYTGGTEKWHNFVKNDENGLYILKEDGFEKLESQDKLNMGDSKTLTQFLDYGYDNYKAEKYNLILYDHGGAIDGAIYDDYSNDNLTLEDMRNALKDSKFNEKNKLDAVLFRTCLNGTIEVANVFAPYADYLIGSEEISYGSNYTDVLSFINNVESKDKGSDFGKKFVDSYEEQMDILNPRGSVAQTYSVIDLSKISNVNKELDKFINEIDLEKDFKKVSKIRANLFQYGSDVTSYDMIDLYSFAEQVSKVTDVDADGLIKAIDAAVIYNKTNEDTSHGLSIYFPFKGKVAAKNKFLGVYKELDFSEGYKKFISKYNNMLTANISSYVINLDGNKSEAAKDGTEVSIQLTPEQMDNSATISYLILQKNKEHPNYYYYVYLSNDFDIDENGLVTTKLTNNIPKISDDSNEIFFMKYEKNPKEYYYNAAVVYNLKSTIEDIDDYVASADFYYYRDGDELKLSTAKLRTKDERINGTLVDLEKFNYAEVVFSERRILDDNGNVLPTNEWESSPYINAVKYYPKDTKITFGSLDTKNNEYYCLFLITDVAGNTELSKLIKVGG